MDLLVTDTVPLGAGLSSSADLEGSTALAVDELFGLGLGGTPSGPRALAAPTLRREDARCGAGPWAPPASAPRTTWSARPRAGWTRPRHCWVWPATLSCSTCATERTGRS